MTSLSSRYVTLCSFFLLGTVFLGACRQHAEGPPSERSEMQTSEQRRNCPTCGMYADMTPDWQARIDYQDGSALQFDVPEHMLAFYTNPAVHRATDDQKNLQNVATITVKDHNSKSAIDAREAFYVIESDLKSPMGKGAVPFSSRPAAEQFQAKHGGRILAFSEFTPEIVRQIQ